MVGQKMEGKAIWSKNVIFRFRKKSASRVVQNQAQSLKKASIAKARKNVVGSIVRQKRYALGLNQDELAARLGRIGWTTSENVLSKIEAGFRRVSDEEVALLARALRTDVGSLFPD